MSMPHVILLCWLAAVVGAMFIAAAYLNSFWLGFAALGAAAVWVRIAEYIFDK